MPSFVAEPATNTEPASPDLANTLPGPAAPEDDPIAAVIPSPVRPSIGPPAPPRSEFERLLDRCDRLRLR